MLLRPKNRDEVTKMMELQYLKINIVMHVNINDWFSVNCIFKKRCLFFDDFLMLFLMKLLKSKRLFIRRGDLLCIPDLKEQMESKNSGNVYIII